MMARKICLLFMLITPSLLAQTPVQHIEFDGYDFYVKRDDLLHPEFSGNKARKFRYFLDHGFPDIQLLIGYGSAQANSLYSMAALAKLKGWQLHFYVDHLPQWLVQRPLGNYRAARLLGAEILAVANQLSGLSMEQYLAQQVLAGTTNTLFVPEGGRCRAAEYGVRLLAQEIQQWSEQQKVEGLKVFLPSGTGTTALYLAKYFHEINSDIEVLTCAVVGGDHYLLQQFAGLSDDRRCYPSVITPTKKYHFGKLYREFYQIWQQLNKTGITFELLYDPLGWLMLLNYKRQHPQRPIMYIHQGGLLGNESMLPRYARKYGVC
ncbi:pyridoxal-phosphate dependent enzyme [Shewanella sp. A32]|uniref:pyridoxal-phosphate dependent enzyme n=1 Tax=Shewanella sp. A32 TaxID=3031327 RepID=UPI0023B8EF0F|nr:pyridoxal-phosphate dependent enzyme [Shewanella sp. A32]MDF0534889.1 pyridoxal-phosphate dependent enzyme [Shewanella sp. A32]